MTDGIIQQVFRENKPPFNPYFNYTNSEVQTIINRLQQELIEKIKQEFPFNTNKSTISDMTIRKILIGDNQ